MSLFFLICGTPVSQISLNLDEGGQVVDMSQEKTQSIEFVGDLEEI